MTEVNGVALQANHVGSSNNGKIHLRYGMEEAKGCGGGKQDAPDRKDEPHRSRAREVEESWPASEKAVGNVGCHKGVS